MFSSVLKSSFTRSSLVFQNNLRSTFTVPLRTRTPFQSLKKPNFINTNTFRYHSDSQLNKNQESFKQEGTENFSSDPLKSKANILGGSLSFAFITSTLILALAANKYQNELKKDRNGDQLHWLSSMIQAGFEFRDVFGSQETTDYQNSMSFSWQYLKDEVKSRANIITEKWALLSRGEKAIWGIIGINIAVFALWKVPKFEPFMTRNFCHFAYTDRYYTMLTSVFSHRDLFHIGFNMMALHSFGQNASLFMSAEHLVGFYLTAGILASLARRIAFSLPKVNPLRFMIPSIGASGAIFGIVAFVASRLPEAKTSIIFLPGINFELKDTLACLMLLDFIGILRGWRLFDHFAHLGGALFGVAYGKWGYDYVWIPINKAVFDVRRLFYRYTQ